jgi:hypothetical protein
LRDFSVGLLLEPFEFLGEVEVDVGLEDLRENALEVPFEGMGISSGVERGGKAQGLLKYARDGFEVGLDVAHVCLVEEGGSVFGENVASHAFKERISDGKSWREDAWYDVELILERGGEFGEEVMGGSKTDIVGRSVTGK